MAGLMSEVDVAVIGAGSAGIAAARRLVEAGHLSVLVLEARERAGGRAWTVEADGLPMDLGCEWLHSADRNVLVPLAEQLGFSINHQRPDWTTRLRHSGESEEDEADKLAAAAGLPLGLADKLFFAYDGDLPERLLIGSTRRRETMTYQLRPFGRP